MTLNTTTTTERLGAVKARQVVWPQWMRDATEGLTDDDEVEVQTAHTPFGSYVLGLAPVLDQAYVEWCEEQEAVAEGRAVELMHCYLCYLDATGKPDLSPHADQGPLRGVVKHTTSRGSDPYDVVHLTCGHGLI